MVSLLGFFAQAISAVGTSSESFTAKQKAREALEGVYSSRNDTSIAFAQIQNISNGGIFKDGFGPLNLPSVANGIVGTGSDQNVMDSVRLAGPDGVLNTADDILMPLFNYQRQILIQNVINPDLSVNPDLRKIVVTIRVTKNQRIQDFVVQGYISRFP
jgi:hypothetical protein